MRKCLVEVLIPDYQWDLGVIDVGPSDWKLIKIIEVKKMSEAEG